MNRTPRNTSAPRRPETALVRAGGAAASFASAAGAAGQAPSGGSQNDAQALMDPWNFRLLV